MGAEWQEADERAQADLAGRTAVGCLAWALPPYLAVIGVLGLVTPEDFFGDADWDHGRKIAASLALIGGAPLLAVLGRGVGRGEKRAWWAYLAVAAGLAIACVVLFRAAPSALIVPFFGALGVGYGVALLVHREVRRHCGVRVRPRRPPVDVPPTVARAAEALQSMAFGLTSVPLVLVVLVLADDRLLDGITGWGPWILLWSAVAAAHFVMADQVARGTSWSRWAATALSVTYAAIGLALLVFSQEVAGLLFELLAPPAFLLHTAEARRYYSGDAR